MKNFSAIFILFLSLAFSACAQKNHPSTEISASENQESNNLSQYSKAYFASGCFWCVETVFESVKGVEEVISGYSGGEIIDPTYQKVSSGMIKHAEAVEIYYDPEVVSFETLLEVFFGSHDPTTYHRQGSDAGPQYRSIAFYQNEKEKIQIELFIKKLTTDKVFRNKIVTEVSAFDKFYPAEDYHQNYERLNPENPYVQAVSIPRLKKFQNRFPELLKTKH